MNETSDHSASSGIHEIGGKLNHGKTPRVLDYQTPDGRRRRAATLIKWSAFLCLTGGFYIFIVAPGCGCGHTDKPLQTKATADVDGMVTALRLFGVQNDRDPTTAEGLQALLANPGNLEHWEKVLDTNTIPNDPWQHHYIYRSPGMNGAEFDLLSAGPDGIEGTADDISANAK